MFLEVWSIPIRLLYMKKILPKNIELVIFDLDGTLVDAYPAIAESVNYMLEKMGRPVQSLLTIKRSVGWGVDSLVRCFIEEERADQALSIFKAHHDERLRHQLKLQPGAKALLSFLSKKGYRLAIASNRPTKFCWIILETLGLEKYFFKVVGGDGVKKPKPHPEMLRMILKEASLPASRAVYVGDMSVDIQCGKGAGVFMIALPTGSCTIQELKKEKPDMLVACLKEVHRSFASI